MKSVRWVLLTLLLWGAFHRTPPHPVVTPRPATTLQASHPLLVPPFTVATNFAHTVRGTSFVPSTSPPKKPYAKRFLLLCFTWRSAASSLNIAAIQARYVPSLRERIAEVPSSPRDPPFLRLL